MRGSKQTTVVSGNNNKVHSVTSTTSVAGNVTNITNNFNIIVSDPDDVGEVIAGMGNLKMEPQNN